MPPIFPSNPNGASVEAIDRCLPQTLCRQCGFEDCASYAEAIATGAAPVNRCAPGGAEGIRRLCAVTGAEEPRSTPSTVTKRPLRSRRSARRNASAAPCACAPARPTPSSERKRLHAVDVTRCTGCARCAPACPMDPYRLVPKPAPFDDGRRRTRAPSPRRSLCEERQAPAEEHRRSPARARRRGRREEDLVPHGRHPRHGEEALNSKLLTPTSR